MVWHKIAFQINVWYATFNHVDTINLGINFTNRPFKWAILANKITIEFFRGIKLHKFIRSFRCLNKALIVFLLVAITMAALALAQMPHRAVLENDAFENQLPPHLRNHFYRTPRVREALARSSLLGPGESAVVLCEFHEAFKRWPWNKCIVTGGDASSWEHPKIGDLFGADARWTCATTKILLKGAFVCHFRFL